MSSAAPAVAIVIPTYNRADLLPAAVDAALAQTAPCRIIVVDDGSTDDTEEVARRYGDRITYVKQANAERGAARNHGARIAGPVDYLVFLDSDDLLAPDHVASLVELLEGQPRAPFAAARITTIDGSGHPLHGNPERVGEIDLAAFLAMGPGVNPSCSLIRRTAFDAVGGFDPDRSLAGSEDWLLFASLLTLAPGLRGAMRTAMYRLHGGNSVNNARSMRRTMLEAHRRFFDGDRGLPYARLRASSRARLLLLSAINWYAAGEPIKSRSDLVAALREHPSVALDPRLAWTAARSLLPPSWAAWLRDRKRDAQRRLSRARGGWSAHT